MELQEIITAQNVLEEKYEKKKAQIEKLEKQYDRLRERAQWIGAIVIPLAKEIKKVRGYYSYETLGPFGLTCELSIWFWKTKEDAKERDLKKMVSLTVRPAGNPVEGEEFKVRSTIVLVTHKNPDPSVEKGSIGSMNGFQYQTVQCDDWSMEQILEFMDNENSGK